MRRFILNFLLLLLLISTDSLAEESTSDACWLDFDASRYDADMAKESCMNRIANDLESCLVIFFLDHYDITGGYWHNQHCHDLYAEGETLCYESHLLSMNIANETYATCVASQNGVEIADISDGALVFVDTDDGPREDVVMGGETFEIADGDVFAGTVENYIDEVFDTTVIEIPSTIQEYEEFSELVDETLSEVETTFGTVFVIDHGGDIDGDGNTDQSFGADYQTTETFVEFSEIISEVTDCSSNVYLCGCNLGTNEELCQQYADEWGTNVWACPVGVVYHPENGCITNLDQFKLFVPSNEPDEVPAEEELYFIEDDPMYNEYPAVFDENLEFYEEIAIPQPEFTY